jgi:cytochrome c-type biogenesis protein CcmH/NrfF
MRRLIASTVVALTLSAAVASTATAAATPGYSSALSQFMCVSCHEPLELVNSPQAISEKQTMRTLLAKGLTMSQLKAAMVAQYGQEVLAQPPASGFNLTVYILPPAIFLGGLALLAYTLPRWRERSRRAAATRLDGAAPLAGDDAKRLDDELQNFV